jgi:hypothetical protein
MATYNKYNSFAEALTENVNCGTDTWRIILSNTAPSASNTNQASANELTTGGGYTVNGNQATVSSSTQTAGVYKLVLNTPTAWTASGGGFTFRYAILWNQTNDVLAGWWDRGSSLVMTTGDTFTATLSGSNGVFTVT